MILRLFVVLFSFTLVGCAPEETKPVSDITDNVRVTVLRATTDVDDISDLTVLCVDGVKYIVMPGIGMSVKFAAPDQGDPYPERCVNHK